MAWSVMMMMTMKTKMTKRTRMMTTMRMTDWKEGISSSRMPKVTPPVLPPLHLLLQHQQ